MEGIFNTGSASMSLDNMSESTVTAPSRKLMSYSDKSHHMSRNILSSSIETPLSSGGSPRQKKISSENVDDHNVAERLLDGRKEGENGHGLRSDGGMLTPTASGSLNVCTLIAYLKLLNLPPMLFFRFLNVNFL